MRRYLALFALSLAITLATAAGFARLVNPYGYWAGPDLAGFNRFKPQADRHLLAVKQAQYARVAPRTLLAGNSRVSVGLDPASSMWPAAMRPVYNFGLPGKSLHDSVQAAMDAAERHRPDTILLGVDFPDFRMTETQWRSALPAPEPARYAPSLAERTALLLSTAVLSDAFATLAEQRQRYPATLTSLGQDGSGAYQTVVAAEGHQALFAQKQQELLDRYRAAERRQFWPGAGTNSAWEALDALADYCARRGIALKLFTYPYHADMLGDFAAAGMLDELADWRRRIARFADARRLPLYDFTTMDEITAEPVPAAGDTHTAMHWFWEPSHFKPALGDRMIASMTGRDGPLLTPSSEPRRTDLLIAAILARRYGTTQLAAR